MFNIKSISLRQVWPIGAFIIVLFIIWNTNILFQEIKHQERLKMEMWAMAQKEFIENKNPTNLTFKVLQQTGINPMYQVDINGKIVGETTSGNFSFCYNVNMAFGYINTNIKKEDVGNNFFEIEVATVKYKARILLEPLHDPKNITIKS